MGAVAAIPCDMSSFRDFASLPKAGKAARSALPSACRICGAWPDGPVCDACVKVGAPERPRCTRCALPLPLPDPTSNTGNPCPACRLQLPPWRCAYAAVDYTQPWSTLVADLKFHGTPGLAVWMAARMAQVPGVALAIHEAHAVLPVPLSSERLRERGYNQSERLAHALAGPRKRIDWLQRVRSTDPQTGQARPARLSNLSGAFALAPRALDAVRGSALLVVDDVMTTGATLSVVSQVLIDAGAASVDVLVFARTPPPGDSS